MTAHARGGGAHAEVPIGPTMGCCERHAGLEPRVCPACKLEDFERVIDRLADPMQPLTASGVLKLAQDVRARWR